MRETKKTNTEKTTIGQMIKAKLRERKQSVVWFAGQLECSRTNIYKIFKKNSIDTDELMKISLILDYDFFKIYSDKLKNV
ncbi:XRE family transcriptional regulator [uncultured Prevotella sp.]|uniref:XRE family transcriptional regulator n=1 Tax=uncultured Prevotella sp. TaxID=159272 RepID=UPI0026389D39|nr:XRE family transcriptional regulator [uncultured Prevotella sp.]